MSRTGLASGWSANGVYVVSATSAPPSIQYGIGAQSASGRSLVTRDGAVGSKYRVIPQLVGVFADLDFDAVIDPFSGSGVVAYAKCFTMREGA